MLVLEPVFEDGIEVVDVVEVEEVVLVVEVVEGIMLPNHTSW